MRSCKGIYFAAAPLTLSLIPGTPGAASSTAATSASTENIGVYLAITISTRVDIVYKQITKIAKDIQAINCQLKRLKDSLSKIKNKLTFIRYGITILIHNAGLPDIEFK